VRPALLAISLIVAMALPATVAGAGTNHSNDLTSGAAAARGTQLQVSFTVLKQGRVPIAIRRFRFRGLAMSCDGGSTEVIRGRIARIKVNNNRFAHTIRRPGKRVRVAGRFIHRGRVVKGTIRGKGDFGTSTNCGSGLVRWRAS
jgi:hypothetical protein